MTRSAIHLAWYLTWLLLLVACSEPPPPLNSDRIRDKFGNYGVEILQASETLRISCLYSGTGPDKVCRTIAVVEFADPIPGELLDQHREILTGGSIGEVMRNAGWTVRKSNSVVSSTRLPFSGIDIPALMQTDLSSSLATQRYDFELASDNALVRYATISEMHHPDYLTLPALVDIVALEQ